MTNLPISVVIPTHGRPEFLAEAIGSVLAQRKMPLEIIVVSDESDRAVEAVEALLRGISGPAIPIRVTRNENIPGASGSRNRGVVESSGEWLAFLDDDDLWTPHFLERNWSAARAAKVDMAVSWVEIFRGEQKAPGVNIRAGLTAHHAGARTPGLTGSNFIIRRSKFESIGGFDVALPVMNDIDFMYRYLASGGEYAVNSEMDMLQRRHSSGQLTRATIMRADGIRKYTEKHRATLRLSDRRHLRLVEYRTRYRAEPDRIKKLGYLVRGVLSASFADIALSIRNWGKRGLWHEERSR